MLKLGLMIAGFAISFAAQAQGKAPTAQQSLMATCNKEAGEKTLKGEERKKFMSTCLSDGKKRQNEKMKTCNAEVKAMKGDERKKALSECLKKQAARQAGWQHASSCGTPAGQRET